MSEKKRLLILSANAGFGHLSAAKALAKAAELFYADNWDCHICNPLDDPACPAILHNSQKSYDTFATKLPDIYQLGFEASDHPSPKAVVERALMLLLYPALRKILKEWEPDLIISTYPLYQAPFGAVRETAELRIPLICCITDFASVHSLWYSPFSQASTCASKEIFEAALANGLKADKVHLLGIPVNPLFATNTKDRKAWKADFKRSPDKTHVLLAGSSRSKRIVELAQILNHSGFPLELSLVCGGNTEAYERLQQEEWHIPCTVYNKVDFMAELLLSAGLVICKAGGLILSEALAAGTVPIIVENLPGQEEGNLKNLLRRGLAVHAPDTLRFLQELCHLFNNEGEKLKALQESIARVGHSDSARKTLQLAIKTYHEYQKELEQAQELEKSNETTLKLFPDKQNGSSIPALPKMLELIESLFESLNHKQ